MVAKLELLDLDSLETWHSDFYALVYGRDIWRRIASKLDASEIQETAFLSQITCADEYLKDELAELLRRKATEILFARYSHVAAYHGCRVKDAKTYKSRGIVRSDINALIIEARSLFAGIQGFDAALENVGARYLAHNEGKVGLLLSCVRAKQDRNSYTGGSELMRGLANRLGPEAKFLFAQTGRRTLIKCAIPTSCLKKHATFSAIGAYSNNVIQHLIRRRKWPEDDFSGFDGGYMITKAVSPDNLLDFIDMTDFTDDNP